ncbi:hypothetical protein XENORESO_018460 [Xenotaenia resolanae]|uniref:Uncharacterized protein n=1 Tax=Xenotaenia resolanae TaxID=208358 RepID=A0ABV0VRJ3_9TELE
MVVEGDNLGLFCTLQRVLKKFLHSMSLPPNVLLWMNILKMLKLQRRAKAASLKSLNTVDDALCHEGGQNQTKVKMSGYDAKHLVQRTPNTGYLIKTFYQMSSSVVEACLAHLVIKSTINSSV